MSKRFRLLLSGAFALLALLGCLAYGDAVRSEAEAAREEALQRYGGEVTTIVVAIEDLEVGDAVSTLNCEEREWVADLVPEGSVTSLDETVGTILSSPISKGTPLTQVAIRDASETLDIPAGMGAYTIAVNERTGILSSVPLGTTLIAYRIDDGGTSLLSGDVMVIGRDPDGGSKITVAVPYEDLSDLIAAATDRSLRLVQPSGLSDELGGVVLGDEYHEPVPDDSAPAEASGTEDGSAVDGFEEDDGTASDGDLDGWNVEEMPDATDEESW